MKTQPSERLWARVKYTVQYTEERTVEIPVDHKYDPNDPQGMKKAIEEAARSFQPRVMAHDFKHEFDLRFKPIEVQVAYPTDYEGKAYRETEYRFKPIPILYLEGTADEEVSSELLDPPGRQQGS